MDKLLIQNANIIGEADIFPGDILLAGEKIASVFPGGAPAAVDARRLDAKGLYASPGFIDLHTHGAGGADFMDGTPQAFVTACQTHLEHGTTTILPTTLSAGTDEIYRTVDSFRQAKEMLKGAPYIPGLHLEGPYFSMEQRGAQDARFIKDPDPGEYRKVLEYAAGDIARWSIAPELPGAMEMGDYLCARGVLPSIAHSNAEYNHVQEAFRHGYSLVTHLYSGMSTIVRRSGFRFLGVIESSYVLEELTVELIADGCHLPPELLRMVYRLKGPDRCCMITDSLRCTGLDVTESVSGSRENGQRIIIEDGVAKLPDRSAFAGSIATAERLVATAYHKAGIPLRDCVRMMSLTPARVLHLEGKKGSIAPGKDADILLFDEDIRIRDVFCGGRNIKGQQ